jgi:hypothetical protein
VRLYRTVLGVDQVVVVRMLAGVLGFTLVTAKIP